MLKLSRLFFALKPSNRSLDAMWVAVTSWEAQINILTWMGRSDALKMDFNLQIGLKVLWDLAHSVGCFAERYGVSRKHAFRQEATGIC